MSTWANRRDKIVDALSQLGTTQTCPAPTSDAILHQTILRCLELQNARKDLPPQLKIVAANSLSIDDFRSLAVLSSSGPFSSVELVDPGFSLTGSARSARQVLVVKTADRRWAFRMRQQQSIVHELAVLRLALSDSSAEASSRIPRLIASFLSPSSCHLVISHAPGGDLWTLLEASVSAKDSSEETGLPEEWVKFWCAELVDAVQWLHERGWTHRDIKPHNLLLLSSGHLQLTDFGSAAPLLPEGRRDVRSRTFSRSVPRKFALALVGTPDYISPEILRYAEQVAEESNDFESSLWRDAEDERAYGNEVDWWSCGVVMYELLFGQAPFFAESIAETYERIVNFQEYLNLPTATSVSEDARDCILQLLVEAEERADPSLIKRHSWFRDLNWSEVRNLPAPYTPPPFDPPEPSPSESFSHHRQSSASFTTFTTSFFSSPGLSILRPSPATLEGAKTEERKYWAAAEIGGLTMLPPGDAFESGSPSKASSLEPTRSANSSLRSPPVRGPPTGLAVKDKSRFSYETPARPLRTGSRLDEARQEGATPSSSARSRRMISDVEAWKEMQEHAWEVGVSAKKSQAWAKRPGDPRRPAEEDTRARSARAGSGNPVAERASNGSARGQSEGQAERELGSLEARHEEMVKDLEAMTKKYGSLFDLVSKEGLAS
ncbi:hypothetical protein JCM3766R1_000140 [Sporobolomyces carnicolor]